MWNLILSKSVLSHPLHLELNINASLALKGPGPRLEAEQAQVLEEKENTCWSCRELNPKKIWGYRPCARGDSQHSLWSYSAELLFVARTTPKKVESWYTYYFFTAQYQGRIKLSVINIHCSCCSDWFYLSSAQARWLFCPLSLKEYCPKKWCSWVTPLKTERTSSPQKMFLCLLAFPIKL